MEMQKIMVDLQDMDLIEVLWKQDVDLGFSLEANSETKDEFLLKADSNSKTCPESAEKLKCLQKLKEEATDLQDEPPIDDPWAGLSYTIDMETGEYVLKQLPEGSSLPLEDFLLEEALQLAGLEDPQDESLQTEIKSEATKQAESSDIASENQTACPSSPSCSSERGTSTTSGVVNATEEEDLDLLCDMIQTAQFNHAHPRSHPLHHGQLSGAHAFSQPRMPISRSMSMEQRWQDFASSFLGGPAPPSCAPAHLSDQSAGGYHPHGHLQGQHHPHQATPHHAGAYSAFSSPNANGTANSTGYHLPPGGVLLHNATLAPPMGDLNPGPVSYGPNLGSAVTSSMHLTNASEAEAIAGSYKSEGADMLYYQNSSIDGLNQTTDGFLNSILNDEDLQLMDMAVNEGMYTMRMLDAAHQQQQSNATQQQGASSGVVLQNGATAMVGVSGSGHGASASGHTGGTDRMDASSDSAVSSMGSERVPSLSDGEWGENGSDSAQDYHHHQHHSKYSPYDYSYNTSSNNGTASISSRQPPVAQKKHHMFARRYFQEQNSPPSSNGNHLRSLAPPLAPHVSTPVKFEYEPGHYTGPGHMLPGVDVINGHKTTEFMPEMKYSCTMDFARQQSIRAAYDPIAHNHTYHMSPHMAGATPRPQTRDKKDKQRKNGDSPEEHLTRDEKRARALNVPIQVHDIINLPMDEFNERLSKHDLTESQLSLIRDIRRRGKNKVAAQNCRKRKLDQIVSLADEVKDMRERKHRLLRERDHVINERQRIKDKFAQLYRHVFQNLRDSDGNPYSQYQYSLQQSADGSVVLVPRSNNSLLDQGSVTNSTNDSMDPTISNNNLHRQTKE
ncbi:segmentation protein cap'n'collar-like isoform X4 [Ctenocephalides felis]|uniref:segmentation protein cap'n'collar-like isoform X4 n=1 Tax=Ctenocephalides felis TaxID=7515 RepID=UPI000E6E3E6B|nr:segmentation protein cap'n'collar-like isoform X4 [Ctenocephalides felis]